jgi:hypothetical protein
MRGRVFVATCAGVFLASTAAHAQPPCPTVTQKKWPVLADAKTDTDLKLDTSKTPALLLAQQAVEIVGRFESGGAADPWLAVSNRERLSLGVLQWNWTTGSLRRQLLKALPDAAFDSAPSSIRDGLRAIADGRPDAEQVITDWTTPRPGDKRIYGVRASVVRDLRTFLGSDALRRQQQALVAQTMRKAYALSRAWMRDRTAGAKPPEEVDARTLAYFFDLETFNSGLSGLWLNHVREFRAQHASRADAVKVAADWIKSCQGTQLYEVPDALRNADYWPSLVSSTVLTDNQIDLFVLGLLRAWRSVGDDGKFPGIYQADVLNRRGIIALGSGYSRREPKPIHVF